MPATKGHCYAKYVEHAGEVHGRWTVIKFSHYNHGRCWLCRCECGTERPVKWESLRAGTSLSCGCLAKEVARSQKSRLTHGLSKTKDKSYAYGIWDSMRRRCNNPKEKVYPYYGGRGIKVCEEWNNSYEAFLRDMGKRPSKKHSIDRIDVNKDYEKSNCRWATPKEQRNNQRPGRLKILTYQGRSQSMLAWSEELELSYYLVRSRLRYGWSDEDALSTQPYNGISEADRKATQKALMKIRTSKAYRQWRADVHKKHGHKCYLCRSKQRIEAHHIKPFESHPDLRLDIENGMTLCFRCHIEIVHKGNRSNYPMNIEEIEHAKAAGVRRHAA